MSEREREGGREWVQEWGRGEGRIRGIESVTIKQPSIKTQPTTLLSQKALSEETPRGNPSPPTQSPQNDHTFNPKKSKPAFHKTKSKNPKTPKAQARTKILSKLGKKIGTSVWCKPFLFRLRKSQ